MKEKRRLDFRNDDATICSHSPMNSGVPTMTVGLGLMERSWAVPKSMIFSCSALLSFSTIFSGCSRHILHYLHNYRIFVVHRCTYGAEHLAMNTSTLSFNQGQP